MDKLTKSEVRRLESEMETIPVRYMMGTKAYHLTGDISRGTEDLFVAHHQTDEYWVGNWVTGFGFANVMFPKQTSRRLTDAEVEKYNKTYIQLADNPPVKLNVDEE